MGASTDGTTGSIDVLPLEIGAGSYAVRVERVGTVLRTGSLGDIEDGTEIEDRATVEVADHVVEVADAGRLLGESTTDHDAIVVFNGADTDGLLRGWLVDDVGTTRRVTDVRPTVGAMRAVRGKVGIDGTDAVLLDPGRIDRG